MSLVLFTKSLSDHDVPQLIERGRALGVDGFDLCVRAGHPVQPDDRRHHPGGRRP